MRRGAAIAVLAVGLFSMLGAGTPALGGTEPGVRPRVWVGRVCRAALPAVEELAERMEAAANLSDAPTRDVGALIHRVELLNDMVSGLRDTLAGMRRGIAGQGVPRIPDARRTVRVVAGDLDDVIGELDAGRDLLARFLAEADVDPQGAAPLVDQAIEQHLTRRVLSGLVSHWPLQLKAAMDASAPCQQVSRLMRSATAKLRSNAH